jgi:hypothetical protein
MTGRVLLYRYKYKDGSEEVHEGDMDSRDYAIGTPSAKRQPSLHKNALELCRAYLHGCNYRSGRQ